MPRLPATILVVDDDDGYCELVRRHLKRGGITGPIVAVTNGGSALEFIFCRGHFVDRLPLGELIRTRGSGSRSVASAAPKKAAMGSIVNRHRLLGILAYTLYSKVKADVANSS